jgi:4a-hydroxytetrahydrobiopterin dehydratase
MDEVAPLHDRGPIVGATVYSTGGIIKKQRDKINIPGEYRQRIPSLAIGVFLAYSDPYLFFTRGGTQEMSDRVKLDDHDLQARLQELRGWSIVGGKLHRQFLFKDFVEAFGFMTAVALIAESMNHHPDWSNVYNRVTVELTTHDAGGITAMDFAFAKRVDLLPASASAHD